MMKNSNFSIHKLLNNNKVVFIIALIVAIGIWITVSPQRDVSITCPITIDTSDSSAGKLGLEVVDGKEQDVSVSVQGKWYTISELTSKDINLTYSLSGIVSSGDYELTLSATKVNTSADFTITGVSPDKVKVSLDHITTADYKVEVVTNNIKAKKGLIAGTPIVDTKKSTISVTGPATTINKLKRVVAEVNVSETLSDSKVYTTELKFLNKKNKEIDTTTLTLPFKDVEITIPINQSKNVPIKATFTNAPSDYASSAISHKLSVSKLDLIGTTEALDKINKIELDAIDFRDISPKKHKFKIKLQLPSGVTAENGTTSVLVSIDMSGYSSKTFKISKFVAVNNKSKVTATVESSYKSVVVVGPSSVIDNLTSDDLYLQYDLSNASGADGSMNVDALVKSTKYKNIWGVGDCQIQIKVSD